MSSTVAPGWFLTRTNASRLSSFSSMGLSIESPASKTCFFVNFLGDAGGGGGADGGDGGAGGGGG